MGADEVLVLIQVETTIIIKPGTWETQSQTQIQPTLAKQGSNERKKARRECQEGPAPCRTLPLNLHQLDLH